MNLRHHGDADAAPGLLDLAVNVRTPTPAWLLDALTRDPARWAAYPDPRPATEALGRRHGLQPAHILPTPGAAAAFALIATLRPRRPVVVHPQFTEPEAALLTAGLPVARHVLPAACGFVLDPDAVPDGDLVIIGNPTNPTGTLHPAAALEALRRPGRTLVVDEAFMDFVPDEPESMIAGDLTGVLVVRSLTKMWGLAGIRAGYVAGDPKLIARLADAQRPWAVSTPALDAMVLCGTPAAQAEARGVATRTDRERTHLLGALAEAGFPAVGHPRTPFVLVDTSAVGPGSVRSTLAQRGLAVRRGETFPGLGPAWIRVAVRDRESSRALASALADLSTR